MSTPASINELGVIARTTAKQYKNAEKTIKEIGEELGVDYVLEGTVRWQKSPSGTSRVRVTPQLIRVSDETYVWSNRYDAVLADVFEVQSEIAQKVTQALDITLLEVHRLALQTHPTDNLAAYDYYLRGNEYLTRSREEDLPRAVQMYEKAVELDGKFALAHAKLSEAHTQIYWQFYDRTEERLGKARASLDRALKLSPKLPEANVVLALLEQLGI